MLGACGHTHTLTSPRGLFAMFHVVYHVVYNTCVDLLLWRRSFKTLCMLWLCSSSPYISTPLQANIRSNQTPRSAHTLRLALLGNISLTRRMVKVHLNTTQKSRLRVISKIKCRQLQRLRERLPCKVKASHAFLTFRTKCRWRVLSHVIR